jgi:hypothetical protein
MNQRQHSEPLELEWLRQDLALVRLDANAPIPVWVDAASSKERFVSATRTDHELSIVAPRAFVPMSERCEGPYAAARVRGILPLELVGVLVHITTPLAQADIPVFVVSTFETDYILVRTEQVDAATRAWKAEGIEVE